MSNNRGGLSMRGRAGAGSGSARQPPGSSRADDANGAEDRLNIMTVLRKSAISYFPVDMNHCPRKWETVVNAFGLYDGDMDFYYVLVPLTSFGGGAQSNHMSSLANDPIHYCPLQIIRGLYLRHRTQATSSIRADNAFICVEMHDTDESNSMDTRALLFIYATRRDQTESVEDRDASRHLTNVRRRRMVKQGGSGDDGEEGDGDAFGDAGDEQAVIAQFMQSKATIKRSETLAAPNAVFREFMTNSNGQATEFTLAAVLRGNSPFTSDDVRSFNQRAALSNAAVLFNEMPAFRIFFDHNTGSHLLRIYSAFDDAGDAYKPASTSKCQLSDVLSLEVAIKRLAGTFMDHSRSLSENDIRVLEERLHHHYIRQNSTDNKLVFFPPADHLIYVFDFGLVANMDDMYVPGSVQHVDYDSIIYRNHSNIIWRNVLAMRQRESITHAERLAIEMRIELEVKGTTSAVSTQNTMQNLYLSQMKHMHLTGSKRRVRGIRNMLQLTSLMNHHTHDLGAFNKACVEFRDRMLARSGSTAMSVPVNANESSQPFSVQFFELIMRHVTESGHLIMWQKHAVMVIVASFMSVLFTDMSMNVVLHGPPACGKTAIMSAIVPLVMGIVKNSWTSTTSDLSWRFIGDILWRDEQDPQLFFNAKEGGFSRYEVLQRELMTSPFGTDRAGRGMKDGQRELDIAVMFAQWSTRITLSNVPYVAPLVSAAMASRHINVPIQTPEDRHGRSAMRSKSLIEIQEAIEPNEEKSKSAAELARIEDLCHSVQYHVSQIAHGINLGMYFNSRGLDPRACVMAFIYVLRLRDVATELGIIGIDNPRELMRVVSVAMHLQMIDSYQIRSLWLGPNVPGFEPATTDTYIEGFLFVSVSNFIRAITLMEAFDPMGPTFVLRVLRKLFLKKGMRDPGSSKNFQVSNGVLYCKTMFNENEKIRTFNDMREWVFRLATEHYKFKVDKDLVMSGIADLKSHGIITWTDHSEEDRERKHGMLGVKFQFIFFDRQNIVFDAICAAFPARFKPLDNVALCWADYEDGDIGRMLVARKIAHRPLGISQLGMSDREMKAVFRDAGINPAPGNAQDGAENPGSPIDLNQAMGVVSEEQKALEAKRSADAELIEEELKLMGEYVPVITERDLATGRDAGDKPEVVAASWIGDRRITDTVMAIKNTLAKPSTDSSQKNRVANSVFYITMRHYLTQLKALYTDRSNWSPTWSGYVVPPSDTLKACFDAAVAKNLLMTREYVESLFNQTQGLSSASSGAAAAETSSSSSSGSGQRRINDMMHPDGNGERGNEGGMDRALSLITSQADDTRSLDTQLVQQYRERILKLDIAMAREDTVLRTHADGTQSDDDPDEFVDDRSRRDDFCRRKIDLTVREGVREMLDAMGNPSSSRSKSELKLVLDSDLARRMQVSFIMDRTRMTKDQAEHHYTLHDNFYGKILPATIKKCRVKGMQPSEITHADMLQCLRSMRRAASMGEYNASSRKELFTRCVSYITAMRRQVQVYDDHAALPFGIYIGHVQEWCRDVFLEDTLAVPVFESKVTDAKQDEAVNPEVVALASAPFEQRKAVKVSDSSRPVTLAHAHLLRLVHMEAVFQTDTNFKNVIFELFIDGKHPRSTDLLSPSGVIEYLRDRSHTPISQAQANTDCIENARNRYEDVLGILDLFDADLPSDDDADVNTNLFRRLTRRLLRLWCATFGASHGLCAEDEISRNTADLRDVSELNWDNWTSGYERINGRVVGGGNASVPPPTSWPEVREVVKRAIDALWTLVNTWRRSNRPARSEGMFVDPELENQRRALRDSFVPSTFAQRADAPAPAAAASRAPPRAARPSQAQSAAAMVDEPSADPLGQVQEFRPFSAANPFASVSRNNGGRIEYQGSHQALADCEDQDEAASQPRAARSARRPRATESPEGENDSPPAAKRRPQASSSSSSSASDTSTEQDLEETEIDLQ